MAKSIYNEILPHSQCPIRKIQPKKSIKLLKESFVLLTTILNNVFLSKQTLQREKFAIHHVNRSDFQLVSQGKMNNGHLHVF